MAPYLRPYQSQSNLYFVGSGTNHVSLKLLKKKRADYILTFSNNVQSQIKINQLPDDYLFYPLSESLSFKKIYVGCSEQPQGRQVIQDVNHVINADFHRFVIQEIKKWNLNPIYQQALSDYYLKKVPAKNVIEDE